MVAMKIAKWGNSLAVRLPAAMVEALDLQAGDDIELQAAAPDRFQIVAKPSTLELIEKLRKYRGSLPEDFKFDRDEANER